MVTTFAFVCEISASVIKYLHVYFMPSKHYSFVEPNDISTASVRDICLFIRGTGLLNLG